MTSDSVDDAVSKSGVASPEEVRVFGKLFIKLNYLKGHKVTTITRIIPTFHKYLSSFFHVNIYAILNIIFYLKGFRSFTLF